MIQIRIDSKNRIIKGIYIKVGTELKRLLAKQKSGNEIKDFIKYTLQKSLEYTFNESTSSSMSNIFTLDNLITVDKITVDNGNVKYDIDGNRVTVSVNGGNSRSVWDSTKYSKYITDYRTSSADSFLSSIPYSSDGYSGTLTKDGSSYVSSGSYTPADSKYIDNFYYSKTISYTNGALNGSFPSTVPYTFNGGSSPNGYTGTLSLLRLDSSTQKAIEDIAVYGSTGSRTFYAYYGGTITKPAVDTRVYRQNYKSYVYKGGYNYYYKYKINIKYTIKN